MPYQRCLNSNIPENAQHFLYDVTNSFVLPLDTLLALLSVVFNSVSLVAILRTRTIQRPSLLLLCGLSMTDVTWAITSLIDNTLSFSLKYSCPKEMRGAGESFAFTLCFFSILGYLAVISFDRLLAVWKPWWYRNNVTRSHAIRQMSFVWMLSAILSGIRAAKWYFPSVQSIFRFLSFVWFFLCILTIVCCYCGVLIANVRHRAAMNQYGKHMRTVLKREKKIANTVLLILVVLCFTFLPTLIAFSVFHWLGFSGDNVNPLRAFYYFSITLNSLLNPLVNYGRNEDVRRAVRTLVRWQWYTGGARQGHAEENGHQGMNLSSLRSTYRANVDEPSEPSSSQSSSSRLKQSRNRVRPFLGEREGSVLEALS